MKCYDQIIIGAGIGGVVSALLQDSSQKTLILEKHFTPGGCAGYFSHGEYSFDVGATTISGIGEYRPLKYFFAKLGKEVPLKSADPGVVIHLDNKIIKRFNDFDQWIEELDTHFPLVRNKELWKKIYEIGENSWKFFLFQMDAPMRSIPRGCSLSPFLFMSLGNLLSFYGVRDPYYFKMIDELMMISLQNKADNVSALVGSMALLYGGETYYHEEGMKGFFRELLASFQGEVRYQEEVLRIGKEKEYFIETNKGSYRAKRIIADIPHWNLVSLYSHPRLEKWSKKFNASWSAMVINAVVKFDHPLKEHYHQVHLRKGSYFVSLKDPNEKGEQVISVSMHVHTQEWSELSKKEYLEKKQKWKNEIWDDFVTHFQPLFVRHLRVGTPQTFFRYTGRAGGRVGGLIHQHLHFLRWPQGEVEKEFQIVGDTVFPGQSIMGITAGILMRFDRITGKECLFKL